MEEGVAVWYRHDGDWFRGSVVRMLEAGSAEAEVGWLSVHLVSVVARGRVWLCVAVSLTPFPVPCGINCQCLFVPPLEAQDVLRGLSRRRGGASGQLAGPLVVIKTAHDISTATSSDHVEGESASSQSAGQTTNEPSGAVSEEGVTCSGAAVLVTVPVTDARVCNLALAGKHSDALDAASALDDLTSLGHLHEPAVLRVLQLRYTDNVIYTFTGRILLAVNPFQRLPLYEQCQRVLACASLCQLVVKPQRCASSSLPMRVVVTA